MLGYDWLSQKSSGYVRLNIFISGYDSFVPVISRYITLGHVRSD